MMRVVLFLLLAFLSIDRAAADRIGLVIGNSAYDQTGWSLANPANDVELVSAALRSVGFDVTMVIDATEDEMEDEFRAYGQRLKSAGPDAIGFFYFAGHGVQSQGLNYLIPTDLEAYTEADVWSGAPRLGLLIRHLEYAGNKTNFVVLDACRNNPLLSSFRDTGGGLAALEESRGMLIAYATAPGTVASDGGGHNSPYAQSLAALIPSSNEAAEILFRKVATRVELMTDNQQQPWVESGLRGESSFCFAGCDGERNSQTSASSDPLLVAISKGDIPTLKALLGTAPNSPYRSIAESVVASSEQEQNSTSLGSKYEPGDEFRDCPSCPEMVVLPSGEFVMGAALIEAGKKPGEGPQRKIAIDYQLAVGKYEVTWDEWGMCVADEWCSQYGPDDRDVRDNLREPPLVSWGKGSRPLVYVSWFEARNFTRWLSNKTGEEYRLLSESEWEYAARSGRTKPQPPEGEANVGCPFVSDPDADFAARELCDDPYPFTAPVGSYAPNAFGLYDMFGNVREWVEDCYSESYQGVPTNGSAFSKPDCTRRVLRGDSWYAAPGKSRASARGEDIPAEARWSIGFRVARLVQ